MKSEISPSFSTANKEQLISKAVATTLIFTEIIAIPFIV
ncbi:MAG: hypothetical protein OFPI_11000 [Osedax symbiont Rs2]|nr:MAG: hypothetical protein OFPI_11000 [Osedax symbiont Rs2]